MSALDDARKAAQASAQFPTNWFRNTVMTDEVLGSLVASLVVIGEELHTANLIARQTTGVELRVDGVDVIRERLGLPQVEFD